MRNLADWSAHTGLFHLGNAIILLIYFSEEPMDINKLTNHLCMILPSYSYGAAEASHNPLMQL